jgi:hypothetical protein
MIEPLCIRDPKATNPVVRLALGQELRLLLSNKTIDLQFNGLFDSDEENSGDKKLYTIRPAANYPFSEWCAYSSMLLGNIIIVRENGESCLSVILTSGQKDNIHNNVLSIINPAVATVRLGATQILEVVIDKGHKEMPAQPPIVYAGSSGLIYSSIGNFTVDPVKCQKVSWVSYNRYLLPVFPRNLFKEEQHFWFVPLMPNGYVASGIYNAGRINFGGSCLIDVNLKLSRKDTKKSKLPTTQRLSNASVKNTISPHRRNVIVEEMDDSDWADGCKTLEFIGNNRYMSHKNELIMMGSRQELRTCNPHFSQTRVDTAGYNHPDCNAWDDGKWD